MRTDNEENLPIRPPLSSPVLVRRRSRNMGEKAKTMHLNRHPFWGVVAHAALILTILFSTSGLVKGSESNLFYFVQITDTHLGGDDHERRTQKVIQSINNLPLKIECIVHTGDITANGLQQTSVVTNAIALLKGLKSPIHFVPGNHDILRNNHDATMQVYTNHFGELISQHEYHGVIFLFVYTEPLAKAFTVPTYEPLQELEARLKQTHGKPVIVFHHSPSVDDFYRNKMHQGWKKDIQARWIELLNMYEVKAVIAGHFHRDEHHWLGNVPLYVSSSIAGYWGRQASYRIYEYKNGKMGYRTQYLE